MTEECDLCKTGTSKAFKLALESTGAHSARSAAAFRGVPNKRGDQDGGQVLQGFARLYGDAAHPVVGRFRGVQLWRSCVRLQRRMACNSPGCQGLSTSNRFLSSSTFLFTRCSSYSCTFPIQFAIIPHSSYFSHSSHSSIFALRTLI